MKLPSKIKKLFQDQHFSEENLSSLKIEYIKEEQDRMRHWVYFKVEGNLYEFFLIEHDAPHMFELFSVCHQTQKCAFCAPFNRVKEYDICVALNDHLLPLFWLVMKGSKNRLRWLTQTVVPGI